MGKDKLHIWLVSKLAAMACPENPPKITYCNKGGDVIIVGVTKTPREKCVGYPDGCERCWWFGIENLAFTGKFDGTVLGVCPTCEREIGDSYVYEDNRLQGMILVPASDVAETQMLGWKTIAKTLARRLTKRRTVHRSVLEYCPSDESEGTKICCQKARLEAVGKSEGCREDENRRADCWISWAASGKAIKLTADGVEPADEDIESLRASWEAIADALARHIIKCESEFGIISHLCPGSVSVATDRCQKQPIGEGMRLFYYERLGREDGDKKFEASDKRDGYCDYGWDYDLRSLCWISWAAAESGVEMRLADWAVERLNKKQYVGEARTAKDKE
ncbi:MAG: hypothetical protein LBC63_03385 [Holophagales bacterium]|jgi:hypothetical protein|nr:hypothetical protein [Holophagales bacterium]